MTTILITLVLIGIFVLTFVSLSSRKSQQVDKQSYRNSWEKLQQYMLDQSTYARAVTDADKLLDRALKDLKYTGKTTAQRLVSAKKMFSKKDHVWMAHKMSDRVVNENLEVTKKQAQAALSAFHKGLVDLDVV
ncbi:MAG: hypothetical protein AAF413_01720 [Patescibacteria group bacterium]